VPNFVMKAALRDPEAILRLLDYWDKGAENCDRTWWKSISSHLRIVSVSDTTYKRGLRWRDLGKTNAAAFCSTLVRLRDLYYLALEVPENWSRVAAGKGCRDDISTLRRTYEGAVHLKGEETGYRKAAFRAIVNLENLKLGDHETLLLFEAESRVEASEAAAFLLFWQILDEGLEVFTCRHCTFSFISRSGQLDCEQCEGLVTSAVCKRNVPHARNRERIFVMKGALYQWTEYPIGDWGDAVLTAWHKHEKGLSVLPRHSRHGRHYAKLWKPHHSLLLQIVKDATYESTYPSANEYKLLVLCSPAEATVRGIRPCLKEIIRLVPVLKGLYRLIRRCDEIQRAMGPREEHPHT